MQLLVVEQQLRLTMDDPRANVNRLGICKNPPAGSEPWQAILNVFTEALP
jgi:hypothetical protein